jgi:hypothetical protein
MSSRLFFWLVTLFIANSSNAQLLSLHDTVYDTNYYISYTEDLTTRLYSSIKYTNFRIQNMDKWKAVRYNTNRRLILGIGANYSVFGLNIGFNLPFNRLDEDKYGQSDYLDLQTHIYARKFNIDLYLQFYEGYYIANPTKILSDWPGNDTFPKRPDINNFSIGFNFQYLFNYRKFSYKAAFVQNEWQKKSAGSFTAGLNTFYITTRGDYSLIPENVYPEDIFYGLQYHRSDVLNVGINGGYYYTLVISKHLFISAGLSVGPSIGYSWLDRDDNQKLQTSGVNLNLNGLVRSALGYNSERIYVGFSFLHQIVLNQLPVKEIWSHFNTGNFRINAVYRFRLNKPIKFLNPRYWKILNKEKE